MDADKLDEVEAIRRRHEAWESTTISVGSHAHTDRATLLRLLDAARAELATVQGSHTLIAKELANINTELAEVREAATWAVDTLHEINVSNYDHDDVCRLNAASVEVALGLAAALAKDAPDLGDGP